MAAAAAAGYQGWGWKNETWNFGKEQKDGGPIASPKGSDKPIKVDASADPDAAAADAKVEAKPE